MFPSKPLRPQLVNDQRGLSKTIPRTAPFRITMRRMNDAGKLILRLTVGVLLLFHGVAKLGRGIGWLAGLVQAHHLPLWLGYGVYIGEVVAPILLIIGFLTRPAAVVVMIDLAMALYLVVGAKTFVLAAQTGAPGGELNFLYIFASLAIVFLGSGRFAASRGKRPWD